MKPHTLLPVALGACLLGALLSVRLAAQGALPRVLAFEEAVKGAEDRELRWPVAVAAASADAFAVADGFGPRLLAFGKVGIDWQVQRVAALPATPVGLAWDGRRYLVALRQGGGLVAFEGPTLQQRVVPLPRGAVPGPLASVAGSGALVVDAAGGRVLRVDADGQVVGEATVPGRVTAIAATSDGGFVTAHGDAAQLRRYGAGGALQATWELPPEGPVPCWPDGVAADPSGDVTVADRNNGRLLVLDATGAVAGVGSRKGWDPGLLLFPGALARLDGERLLVADTGNGRVQIFRRTSRSDGR